MSLRFRAIRKNFSNSVLNTGQLKHIARLWAWFSVNNGHFGHKKEKFRYFTENITLKAYLWPSVTTFSIFMTINRSEAELQSTQNVNWNRFSGKKYRDFVFVSNCSLLTCDFDLFLIIYYLIFSVLAAICESVHRRR